MGPWIWDPSFSSFLECPVCRKVIGQANGCILDGDVGGGAMRSRWARRYMR